MEGSLHAINQRATNDRIFVWSSQRKNFSICKAYMSVPKLLPFLLAFVETKQVFKEQVCYHLIIMTKQPTKANMNYITCAVSLPLVTFVCELCMWSIMFFILKWAQLCSSTNDLQKSLFSHMLTSHYPQPLTDKRAS